MRVRTRLALLSAIGFAFTVNTRGADQVVTDPGDDGGPSQLRAMLGALQSSGGGTLSFNVGTAAIILVNGALPAITTNATIEGANVITLSGGNASRVFVVNNGATLTLNNLTITRGFNTG